MRTPLILCAAALFCAPAKADKFWLSDPAKDTVEGSQPDVVEGVVLEETETLVHLRVVGGELFLSKSRIFKTEKDALTVKQIEDAEGKEQERLGKLAEAKKLDQAAERLRRDVEAVEATTHPAKAEAVEASLPAPAPILPVVTATVPGFDPIVGRNAGYGAHLQIMAELELAWSLTKNRDYLVALRRLRRLH